MLGIITGSRADWGLLYPLVREIKNDIKCTTFMCGCHNRPDSYINTELDVVRVETITGSDTAESVSNSMAMGLSKWPIYFKQYNIDKILVLGDRYEIFAAVIAAYNMGIEIIHLEGGERTRGSKDDSYRDCITRMAKYHLVANKHAVGRVCMVKDIRLSYPDRMDWYNTAFIDAGKFEKLCNIYVTGSLAVNFEFDSDWSIKQDYIIIYHPWETSSNKRTVEYLFDIVECVSKLEGRKLFIGSNLDAGGIKHSLIFTDYIDKLHKEYGDKSYTYFNSLPRPIFLNVLRKAKCIIGNSSCGVIEAPALGVPSVNIGDRQLGRHKHMTVFNANDKESIELAIKQASQIKRIPSTFYGDPDKVLSNVVRTVKLIVN